jgi:phosphopantothenoylcysteine decarboxylase/phosphopantothenate--cysteine ligase
MNILIGVTGSIAIYKTLELIRLFVKNKDNVRVIMTNSAKKFITPLTFETLTRNRVLDETTENWSNDFNHIEIGKWADIFIIAPATANTINKMANGIADNLLLQTYLAFTKEILIAPAANTNMYLHPTTQKNFQSLKKLNIKIIEANSGLLACGDEGIGKMANVNDIF